MSESHLKILALEPYLGGSHQQFLQGYKNHSRHEIDILGLSAHSWKWRIRTGAITLSHQLEDVNVEYDLVLASDFLNVADFRALAPARFARLPVMVYFHENQLTYPMQVEDERDWNYAFINLSSALSAQAVCFNSEFHCDSFLGALPAFLKKNPNYPLGYTVDRIASKSHILYPGIEFSSLDVEPTSAMVKAKKHPVVLWNHRWEHDKNPADFFTALRAMQKQNIPFQLIVLGESFRSHPDEFDRVAEDFQKELIHFGYCEDREEYSQYLQLADIIMSTAHHEFFGIAVLEAMYCKCQPLLPNRLSYPELLGELAKDCIYNNQKDLELKLSRLLQDNTLEEAQQQNAHDLCQAFSWDSLISGYDDLCDRVSKMNSCQNER